MSCHYRVLPRSVYNYTYTYIYDDEFTQFPVNVAFRPLASLKPYPTLTIAIYPDSGHGLLRAPPPPHKKKDGLLVPFNFIGWKVESHLQDIKTGHLWNAIFLPLSSNQEYILCANFYHFGQKLRSRQVKVRCAPWDRLQISRSCCGNNLRQIVFKLLGQDVGVDAYIMYNIRMSILVTSGQVNFYPGSLYRNGEITLLVLPIAFHAKDIDGWTL